MTKLYHGTTRRRAEKILREGFQGKRGLSWFARQKGLARQYAQTRARQRHDDPVILECDVATSDVQKKEDLRVASARGSVVVIQGRIPGEVVSNRRMLGFFWSANEVAAWANRYLGLTGAEKISPSHPGVQRLRKWMAGRFGGGRHKPIPEKEFLQYATRWLPEYFSSSRLHPDRDVRRKSRR